jgi:serine-type D-Ala-D-Ala carboxypeptidase/endopeptidase (penicillin-binding protein 4)
MHLIKTFAAVVITMLTLNVNSQSKISKENDSFNEIIKQFVNDSELTNASISLFIQDINSGEVIGEYNPNLLLAPASTLKLLTTATAIELFGADYRFKTSVSYSGKIDKSGTLNGNIIINGSGDPCFYSENFHEYYSQPDVFESVISEIKKAGIVKINGTVIGNSCLYSDNFVPPSWITGDIANYYGAAPFALSFMDNQYKLFFNTGSVIKGNTKIVKMEPFIREIEIVNNVNSQSIEDDQSIIFGGPFDNFRWIKGSLPINKLNYEVKGSIPNPPLFTAIYFSRILNKNGISISDSCKTNPDKCNRITDYGKQIELKQISSPTLTDIIKVTNIKSMNLYAEHLLRNIGLKNKFDGSNEAGIDAIKAYWKTKIGKFILFDGSGLSRFNAISAKQLVGVLYEMKNSKNYSSFYNSLPIAGKSGSISKMFKGSYAENNLRAKSGFMSGVRSYAGYVKTKSNQEIAFAIIVNNYSCQTGVIRTKMEKFLINLSDK